MLKLIGECIKFDKEQRPLFRQVLNIIEDNCKSIPKLTRSFSEPALNNRTHPDILDAVCNSPTTPIHSQYNNSHFQFFNV